MNHAILLNKYFLKIGFLPKFAFTSIAVTCSYSYALLIVPDEVIKSVSEKQVINSLRISVLFVSICLVVPGDVEQPIPASLSQHHE